MARLRSAMLLAAGTWLAAASPVAGQAPVDSTRLARAIAAVVAGEVLASYRPELELLIVEPTERLEELVARELATLAPFDKPVRDSAQAVRFRVTAAPDYAWLAPELRGLPAVIVTSTACERSKHWGGGHWWLNQVLYVFKPRGEGWEVASGMTLDNADGSCRPGSRSSRQTP